MTTVNFYRDLPVLESFAEAIETARHAQVPGDWWIVIADVMGSTKAIEGGGYKKVNTVGVACMPRSSTWTEASKCRLCSAAMARPSPCPTPCVSE
jgi:hypothetical protein